MGRVHSAGTSACWAAHAKMPRHCPQGQPVWLLFPPRARPTPRPMCWLTRSCPGGEVGHLLPPPTSCFTKPQSRGKRASSMGSGKGGKGAEGSTAPLWFHVCKFMAYIWQKLDTAKALHPGTLEMHLSSCSTPRGPRMRQDIRGGRHLSLPPAGDPGEDAPSVPPSQDASCHHHAPSMGLSGSS